MNVKDPGLTLMEALERYSDPVVWKEFKDCGPYNPRYRMIFSDTYPTAEDNRHNRASTILRRLIDSLLEKLVNGELVSDGYARPLRPDSTRVPISGDKWRLLKADFNESSAAGHGLQLIDIRVLRPTIKRRGRKTETETQTDGIHSAFSRLVRDGSVKFGRGGLAKTVDLLAPEFPNYKPDSIRKIIQTTYQELKKQKK